MSYRIKYNYNTGNSFNNEEGLEDYLELTWEKEDVAQKNLERIKEHYEQYRELHRWKVRWKDKQAIVQQSKNKDWFVKKDVLVVYDEKGDLAAIDEQHRKKFEALGRRLENVIDETTAENCIILYTDENVPWQIWAPWCGYFESLNDVEIVSDDTKNKISFR